MSASGAAGTHVALQENAPWAVDAAKELDGIRSHIVIGEPGNARRGRGRAADRTTKVLVKLAPAIEITAAAFDLPTGVAGGPRCRLGRKFTGCCCCGIPPRQRVRTPRVVQADFELMDILADAGCSGRNEGGRDS